MTMHSTSRRALVAGVLSAAYLGIAAPAALAQDKYPSRPVEFVVPWGPGGGADAVARKAGKMLEESLKTSFPVINVPGATGRTGLNKMLSAQADGYTISVMTGDTFGLLADPQANWSLDQLVPVAIMIRQPSAFMVAENGPIKSWADLEREAKARPIKVAVTGFGSPDDMTVNYFARRGMKLVSVPFAKPGERYSAILGGHADVLYEQPGDVRSFIDNKQMRPVILFGEKRHPAFANVPVSKELGFDITMPQFRMITVKAGTDPAKVKLLSDELEKVAKSADFAKYLEDQLADADSYVSTKDALPFLRGELEAMKKHAIRK
ncbi:MAG: tripartite tricarboxylate transporter substrate binding protein [Burkholderiales bacterium]|nr:MAG: tripartite tricarboxylate transporter substrate binding protein [Burkholderiales bacterium]